MSSSNHRPAGRFRLACLASCGVAAAGLLVGTLAGPSQASSATHPSTVTYTWVGNTTGSGGDNTSWTDARNWEPQGVPNGDASVVIAATPQDCHIVVTELPVGNSVVNFAMTATQGCGTNLQGGSLDVYGVLDWEQGEIDAWLYVRPSATAILGGSDFRSDYGLIDVYGTLELDHTTLAGDPDLIVESGGMLVGDDSTIGGYVGNLGGTVVAGGSPSGSGLTLSDYSVYEGGLTTLSLGETGPALTVNGNAHVVGPLFLRHDDGYTPPMHVTRDAVSIGGGITWHISQYQTEGPGRTHHHYAIIQKPIDGNRTLVVQWKRRASA